MTVSGRVRDLKKPIARHKSVNLFALMVNINQVPLLSRRPGNHVRNEHWKPSWQVCVVPIKIAACLSHTCWTGREEQNEERQTNSDKGNKFIQQYISQQE